MASIFTASTLEEGANGPQRPDSFYFTPQDDDEQLYFSSKWHTSRNQYSMPGCEAVYERVFEPHPCVLASGGSKSKSKNSSSPRIFFSRRPSNLPSPAATLAAEWRASNPSSVASTPAPSPALSPRPTRMSTSSDSGRSTVSNASKLSLASGRVSSALARVLSISSLSRRRTTS